MYALNSRENDLQCVPRYTFTFLKVCMLLWG